CERTVLLVAGLLRDEGEGEGGVCLVLDLGEARGALVGGRTAARLVTHRDLGVEEADVLARSAFAAGRPGVGRGASGGDAGGQQGGVRGGAPAGADRRRRGFHGVSS